MEHEILALHRCCNLCLVSNIPLDEGDLACDFSQKVSSPRTKIIENGDGITFADEMLNKMAPDEAGSAGYEDSQESLRLI